MLRSPHYHEDLNTSTAGAGARLTGWTTMTRVTNGTIVLFLIFRPLSTLRISFQGRLRAASRPRPSPDSLACTSNSCTIPPGIRASVYLLSLTYVPRELRRF